MKGMKGKRTLRGERQVSTARRKEREERRTIRDVLRPLNSVVRPMELAEDEPRLREALTNVVNRVPHPLLPPSKLLGGQRDSERPASLVVLQSEESLEDKEVRKEQERNK